MLPVIHRYKNIVGRIIYMTSDLFGSIGNFFEDVAKSVVPKDTPEGKLLNTESELNDLKRQETELLQEIGRQAYADNPSIWPQDSRLTLIRQNMSSAQSTIAEIKAAIESEEAKGRCPNCGFKNDEGMRFCRECGTSLEAAPTKYCTSCGAVLAPGVRFCGSCGAQQGG